MALDYDFLKLLARHEVPFVIVGGHAVIFHGHRRATEDVDVVWKRSRDAETKLLAALTEAEACWLSNEIDPKTGIEKTVPVTLAFIRAEHLMMLWSKYGFIDLFDYIPGHPAEDVEALFSSSIESEGLRYTSLDWLKRMKRAAGRTKDKLDLEQLDPQTGE